MESIYYVVCWACHRTCPHCYEDRFRPYYGEDLEAVISQAEQNVPKIINNLPASMTYQDRTEVLADGSHPEKRGSIILAGGEILLPGLRERVTWPALQNLHQKYRDAGGVKLIVQTTGDLLTPSLVSELWDLPVWTVSISGLDAYHQGLETEEARERLRERAASLLEDAGFRHAPVVADSTRKPSDDGRYYHFFGATPDSWIGRLWPRGRAWTNNLTSATLEDNFCARWSGGLGFLDIAFNGSEVSIEPDGNVYPCCLKTRYPVGSVLERPLTDLLSDLRGNPIYEAINFGRPEQMGLLHGWSVEKFLEASRTTLPGGQAYENLCIGCDRFHEHHFSPQPLLPVSAILRNEPKPN